MTGDGGSGEHGGGLSQAIHEAVEKLPKIGWGESFNFKCHDALSCWTSCCRNPDLFLMPYDVLRLKNRLGLKSWEFHEKHTTVAMDPLLGLPVVRLKMDGEGACPFVTEKGCGVYADRPTSCRVYPLGQAASSGSASASGDRIFFKVEEDHCLGWKEGKSQTLEEWVLGQGAADYNLHNEIVVRFSFHEKLGEPGKLDDGKLGMIYMSLYDVDRFRQFVFGSTFLKRFRLDSETIEKIRTNDEDILRFAVRWLEFSTLGLPSMEVNA
ncbi:MAG: YkgJ family cysteine cluster protein [Nitrospinae bacterium]|nr:YkgJ family cysteine cluster protein [Nitrospinota bacterium]